MSAIEALPSEHEDYERTYLCHWRHGPAPGLTYYEGKERVRGSDEDDARQRARRIVARRACFEPGCITVYRVEAA